MPRALVFGRCSVCTHAATVRSGAACPFCAGAVVEMVPPPDLFAGWRCACFHCTGTPC